MKKFECERTANAVYYFVSRSAEDGVEAKKVFKLLYMLDSMHYRETASSVTGMHYYPYPKQPKPRELDAALLENERELLRLVEVEHYQDKKHDPRQRLRVGRNASLNKDIFTSAQLDMMTRLADRFKAKPVEAINVSPADGGALDRLANPKPHATIPWKVLLSDLPPAERADKEHRADDYIRRSSRLHA